MMETKKKQSTPPKDKQQRSTVVKASKGGVKVEGKKATVEAATPALPPDTELYTVAEWQGFPLYQCRLCPYNHLKLGDLLSHIASRHGPQHEPSGLVGPTGQPLIKEVRNGQD